MFGLEAKVLWLFVFVALYWSYCIYWGIKGARQSKTAGDYFIAGRSISIWVFVLAATATSFSGWTFMGHPGLIYRDGFPYAYASFYAITIPFTGVLFLKRQWMIGKKFGFLTGQLQPEVTAPQFEDVKVPDLLGGSGADKKGLSSPMFLAIS